MLKRSLAFAVQLLVLVAIYIAVFIAASSVAYPILNLPPPAAATQPADASASGAALGAIPAVAMLNTLVIAIAIARARWRGLSLAAALAFVMFAVMAFMTQIELIVFPAVLNRLPPGTIPLVMVMNGVQALVFAPLAVLVMGHWRQSDAPSGERHALALHLGAWLWRLATIGVLYVGLYFTFGYFVAWRNPIVAAYYGGSDPGNFLAQLASVARDNPWLFLFQFVRGILWALIGLPVIRALKGGAAESGLVLGLLFAVLMSSQLLFPNPAMPFDVRMVHLAETVPSNFILGVVVAEVLLWRGRTTSSFSRPAPILR
ncbi:MAG: hypothetical protein HZB53_14785 [Chloroflexi bacterium]|nr:hypothetical protein [Chloroflexota bacterium]